MATVAHVDARHAGIGCTERTTGNSFPTDYGNVFGGGFLDRVHADGSLEYDPGDWKTRFAAKIPEFHP